MILAIDTSVGVSVAVHDGMQVIAERHTDTHGVQGELCASMIAAVLTQAGCVPADIDTVVVGVGPGPFTGLRVGIVTGTVFAAAVGAQAVGVCSLDAVAHDVGAPCVVVIDARRRELYAAAYPNPADPVVAAPDRIAADHPGVQFVGPGAGLYPDVIDGRVVALRAGALADLVATGHARVRTLAPMYLRAPDATPPAPAGTP